MMKRILFLATCLLSMLHVNAQNSLNDSLVLYYPFNSDANDHSGTGNNGENYGAELTLDRFYEENAFSFDSTDYINVTSNESLNPKNQLTLALWLKIDTLTNTYNPILHKGGPNTNSFKNREYLIFITNSGYLHVEATGETNRFYTAIKVDNKKWFFYSAVLDRLNHTCKIYLDGELQKEVADVNSTFLNNNSSLTIGTWAEQHASYATNFAGSMDDIRIYNRVLTDMEIETLYKEGTCSKLIYDTVPYYDTIPVYDTVTVYEKIAVTDTLVIDVELTDVADNLFSVMKVFPNPTKDVLYIEVGNSADASDYQIKIVGSNSQVVFETDIQQSEFQIDMSDFGSTGLYFIQIYDSNNQLKDVRKIILE